MIAALTLVLAALPQTLSRETAPYDAHVRAVRAERSVRFGELWEGADAETRARALAVLADARSPGAPQGSRPALGALARAEQILAGRTGARDARGDELRAAAAALDLMVVPGAFEARAGGRGDPLTVRVYPVYSALPPDDVVLTLWWLSPSGERRRARGERIARDAFARPGFDMFVGPPASEPGVWYLEPELTPVEEGSAPGLEGAGPPVFGPSVSGSPVPVECVSDLAARSGRLEETLATSADVATRFALVQMQRLLRFGLRTARGPHLSESLTELEMGTTGGPRPLFSGASGEPWGWVREPVGESRAVLVLLTPSQESPSAPFGPAAGLGWRAAADRVGAVLLAGHADLSAGRTPADRVALARSRWPDLPVVLVASGDAVSRLRFALLTGSVPDVDGLVICGASRSPHQGLPDVPALIVHVPDAKLPDPAAAASVTFRLGAGPPFTSEAALPGLVADWIGEALELR